MKYLWDENARELREAVARAHIEYTRAAEAFKARCVCFKPVLTFKAVMRDIPSGLPHPDGAQRIANAAKAEHQALEEYVRALTAFNDYANQKKTPS